MTRVHLFASYGNKGLNCLGKRLPDLGFDSQLSSLTLLTTDQEPLHNMHTDLGFHCREAGQSQNTSNSRACTHALPFLGRPHVDLQLEKKSGTRSSIHVHSCAFKVPQHRNPQISMNEGGVVFKLQDKQGYGAALSYGIKAAQDHSQLSKKRNNQHTLRSHNVG